jgi:putative transposase
MGGGAQRGPPHDREFNAAINLKKLAGSADLKVRPVSACGVEGSGGGTDPVVKPATMKQENGHDQKRSGP